MKSKPNPVSGIGGASSGSAPQIIHEFHDGVEFVYNTRVMAADYARKTLRALLAIVKDEAQKNFLEITPVRLTITHNAYGIVVRGDAEELLNALLKRQPTLDDKRLIRDVVTFNGEEKMLHYKKLEW